MHNAVIVRALQCLAHGWDDAESFFRRESLRLQELAEIHAIHELHEQEVKATRLPEVIHADNIWMIQRRDRVSFFFKPCLKGICFSRVASLAGPGPGPGREGVCF